MASLQEYVRKLTREQLEQMLRESCDCEVCDPILMLALCDALSRFDPELPDPKVDLVLKFLYLVFAA